MEIASTGHLSDSDSGRDSCSKKNVKVTRSRQMLRVSTNLGRSHDKLGAEQTEFRVTQVSDK